MKMIVAIIQDAYSEKAAQALLQQAFRVTHLASTGGLLRSGRTTLMIGVDDQQLEEALSILRNNIPPAETDNAPNATIYVLNVRDFARV